MENKNINIPLVDILSEILNERVVMSGEDYVVFSTLKKIEKSKIDEALNIKAEKEDKTRISEIKSKAQSTILEKYPLAKQSSAQLGLYGDEYLEEMKTFISNIIEISNKAEKEGTKLEDIKWLW